MPIHEYSIHSNLRRVIPKIWEKLDFAVSIGGIFGTLESYDHTDRIRKYLLYN